MRWSAHVYVHVCVKMSLRYFYLPLPPKVKPTLSAATVENKKSRAPKIKASKSLKSQPQSIKALGCCATFVSSNVLLTLPRRFCGCSAICCWLICLLCVNVCLAKLPKRAKHFEFENSCNNNNSNSLLL